MIEGTNPMKMNWNRIALAAIATAVFVPAAFAQEGAKADKKATGPVVCTINGKVIDDASKAGGTVNYNGKKVYFCCGNCKAKFEKSDDATKAKLVKVADLRTEKAGLEKRLEVLNAELKTMTEPEKAAAAAPKTVYCAVTDEEIGGPENAQSTIVYNGKTYYLCCAGCRPKFESDPAKYAKMADEKAAARAKN
ncbi:MAG: hypothetical protein OHK0029_30070 [Armatimonadaceae bacterium]